jgi:hypothetical protein
MNDPGLADLHRVRLGKALGPEMTDPASQVNYRVFEHGIVAVNWDPVNTKSFSVQNTTVATMPTIPQNVRFFYDLYASPTNVSIDVSATSGLLQVPANSGRVFLFGASTDYGLNRLSAAPSSSVAAA